MAHRVRTAALSARVGRVALHINAEAIDASREARAGAVLEQIRRVLGHDVKAEIVVRNGNPADVVARVAEEEGAKLIVTGLGLIASSIGSTRPPSRSFAPRRCRCSPCRRN